VSAGAMGAREAFDVQHCGAECLSQLAFNLAFSILAAIGFIDSERALALMDQAFYSSIDQTVPV